MTLSDYDSGLTARIELPAASRITALADGQPLARPLGQEERSFGLRLEAGAMAPVCIEIVLVEPGTWAARSGQPAPPPPDGPPPLPPRLG